MADSSVKIYEPASGTPVRTENIGGTQHQTAKLWWGGDDEVKKASLAAPVPVQSARDGGSVCFAGLVFPLKVANVRTDGTTNLNTLVAAVSTKKFRVLAMLVAPDADVTVTVRSAAAAILGPVTLAGKMAQQLGPREGWLCETVNANEALGIQAGTGVAATVSVVYVEI